VEFGVTAAAPIAHQDVKSVGELREMTIHSMTASSTRAAVANLFDEG
jgi:hypothetical protein